VLERNPKSVKRWYADATNSDKLRDETKG
jgi:hypothetical protein